MGPLCRFGLSKQAILRSGAHGARQCNSDLGQKDILHNARVSTLAHSAKAGFGTLLMAFWVCAVRFSVRECKFRAQGLQLKIPGGPSSEGGRRKQNHCHGE